MVTPAGPPAKNGGWLGNLIGQLLGYADRPWRALFILGLIIVCGAGFAAWQERRPLLNALLVSPSPHVKLDMLPDVLGKLLGHTSADVAMVWEFELAQNTQHFLLGRAAGGSDWEFKPETLPLIRRDTPGQMISDFYKGVPMCFDPTGSRSLLFERLVREGIHRVCVVAVPPALDLMFGAMVLAWKQPPEPGFEEAAVALELEMANAIVQR